MMKLLFIILEAALLVSSSIAAYDPSVDLLGAFGSRCPLSYGSANANGIADGQGLKSIVEQIRDDSDCSSISNALESLSTSVSELYLSDIVAAEVLDAQAMCQAYQMAYDELTAKYPNDSKNIAKKGTIVTGSVSDWLLNFFGSASTDDSSTMSTIDSVVWSTLESNLESCAINAIEANVNSTSSTLSTRLSTLSNLQSYATSVFTQLSSQDKCLQKHPGLPFQLIGQVGAISGSLIGGVYGAIASVGGVLIDRVVTYASQHHLNVKARKLYQSSMVTASNCAMEAIANEFCNQREALQVLSKFDHAKDEMNESSALVGLDLVEKDMSSYSSWISRIVVDSSSSSKQTQTQLQLIGYKAELKAVEIQLNALESDYLKSEDSEKQAILRRAVQLAATSAVVNRYWSYPSLENPQKEKEPGCSAALLIYENGDFTKTTIPSDDSCRDNFPPGFEMPPGFKDLGPLCQCYIDRMYKIQPTIEQTKRIYKDKLLDMANKGITNLELKAALNNDFIMSEAFNMKPVSPSDFIKKSIDYLSWLVSDYQSRIDSGKLSLVEVLALKPLKDQASDILLSFSNAEKVLLDPKLSTYEKRKGLTEILAKDTEYSRIPSDLQTLVQSDIRQRLNAGPKSDKNPSGVLSSEIISIVRYSSSKTIGDLEALMPSAGIGTAAPITQRRDAMRLAADNLRSFGEVFGKTIRDNLKRLRNRSIGKSAENTYRNVLGQSCVTALLLPDDFFLGFNAKLKMIGKYCVGTKWKDPVSKIELKFNELSKLAYDKRVCSLHNFNKASILNYELRRARTKK